MILSKRTGFIALSVLLVLGMLDSAFLAYEHFSPSASRFCTFGESFNCGIVNKSPYATVDGISYLLTIDYGWPLPLIDISGMNPVFEFLLSNAVLGFFTLLILFVLLHYKFRGKDFYFIKTAQMKRVMLGVLIFGIAYGAYLFYIQHSILKTYCLFCIVLDTIMILSTLIVWRTQE